MKERRKPSSNRRLDGGTPAFPFKDSNGATIKECRRKIADRRKCDMTPEQASQRSNKAEKPGFLRKMATSSFWQRIFMRK